MKNLHFRDLNGPVFLLQIHPPFLCGVKSQTEDFKIRSFPKKKGVLRTCPERILFFTCSIICASFLDHQTWWYEDIKVGLFLAGK